MKLNCIFLYSLGFYLIFSFLFGFYEDEMKRRVLREIRHGSMEDVRSEYEEKKDQFIEADKEIEEINAIQNEKYEEFLVYLKSLSNEYRIELKKEISKLKQLHREFKKKYSNAKDTLRWKDSLVKARRDVEAAKKVHNEFLEKRQYVMSYKK